MPLLGDLGATAKYTLPIAPPGSRGGPEFADGAYSKDECYSDTINVSGQGKMPLLPPAGSLPPDVRDVSNWKIRQTSANSWTATASVTRCGTRKQCMEALYDRDAKTWYCPTLGPACGAPDQPVCGPVPPDSRWTWTDDYVQGRRKVHATAEGDPIFDPAVAPTLSEDPLSALTSGNTPYLIAAGAGLVIILLLRR